MSAQRSDRLAAYRSKRDVGRSGEPSGSSRAASRRGPRFVIQHHAATSDHYDLRLEVDGVLASWAVPKGPSTDPREKRMARRTEDHPLDYETFEGTIAEGYGAGQVLVWDRGTWENITDDDEPVAAGDALERGHLSFVLEGEKLTGPFALTRIRSGSDETWLLVKQKGDGADARRRPTSSQPESVLSGRTLEDIAEEEG